MKTRGYRKRETHLLPAKPVMANLVYQKISTIGYPVGPLEISQKLNLRARNKTYYVFHIYRGFVILDKTKLDMKMGIKVHFMDILCPLFWNSFVFTGSS